MNATMTLAELATTHPGASRVFHRHGLDFCCGGRRPLAEVCDEQGISAEDLVREIEAESATAGDRTRWDARPLPDLIQHIVTVYHARLRAELPELVALAERVESRHGSKPSCPHGLAAHLIETGDHAFAHMAKEEQVLFPMLLAGGAALASGPIRQMEIEHDDHAANLARTRALTGNFVPPAEACPTWRALYVRLDALEAELMEHIHLENHVLFPRALRAES
ncbi:MAG: iron-sulfur cluster repair di-iron protein [Vicinamibacterales bacterium]|nr:iron-sulfur cluster repair di-iron protein [Vicinamibacterales bacterium]